MTESHGLQISMVPGASHIMDLTEQQGIKLLAQSFGRIPELNNNEWLAVAVRFNDVLLLARNAAVGTPEDEGWDTYGLYSVSRGTLLIYADIVGGQLQQWCSDNARWNR